MALQASTLDRSSLIYQQITGDSCKAEVALFYKNSGDTQWKRIEDLDEESGVRWGGKIKNSKPGAFLRIPIVKSLDFNVLNLDGEYCPNESTYYNHLLWPKTNPEKSGVLKDGTKILLKGGYVLPEPDKPNVLNAVLDGIDSFYYNTKYDAGVCLDINTPSENEDYFNDLWAKKYDSGNYDDGKYTPSGYWVYSFDMDGRGFSEVDRLTITTNFEEGRIFYRSIDDIQAAIDLYGDSTDWTEAGDTTIGSQSFNISNANKRYFQVAVIWDGTAWDTTKKVTALSVVQSKFIEWVYNQVYRLDEPSYTDPGVGEIPLVKCQAFDVFSKAIESDFMLPDMSAGKTLDEIVKLVCDAVGIGYSATSIDDLSDYGTKSINPFEKPVKAYTILEKVMQLLTREDAIYEMYTEYDATADDDILYLKKRPDTYYSSFVLAYQKYESIADKKIDRGNLLRRVTVMDGSATTDDDAMIDSVTGYTTEGNLTLSWLSACMFKRYNVTINSGTPIITLVSVSPTTLVLNITGTFNVDIEVWGQTIASAPTYWAEYFGNTPQIEKRGYEHTIENEFIGSTNEAELIAKGYVSEYGTPSWTIQNLKWPYLHLMFEINDPAMIYSRLVFSDTIHVITGITHNWSRSSNPNDSTSFDLQDTGLNYLDRGDIIYDRDKTPVFSDKINYDYGFVYDMRFPVYVKEEDINKQIYEIRDVCEA